MAISNYPNGFMNGVTIRGLPIQVAHPGKVFFLNNSSVLAPNGLGGSDGNPGTYQKPFSTLSYAISACTANRGDIIMVMPGHAETISTSTALTLSTAGVAIVGLGTGTKRPTFTLGTATSATINVTADNISISNCLFVANYAAVVAAFTLTTAKNFTLSDVEVRDSSSVLNFKFVVNVGATSNAADGLTLERVNWYGLGATSGSAAINMAGTNARLTIKECYITHAATSDAGLMPIATGKVVTHMICDRNILNFVGSTGATTGTIITTDGTTNSGVICRNFIQSLDATSEILVTASSGFIFSQNYSSAVADKSGYLLPAADA